MDHGHHRPGDGASDDGAGRRPGGWSPGDHTATLRADDGDGGSASTSVTFTVVGDADNDGVPTSIETGCAGGSDTDPSDGYADDVTTDGGACTAATSYTASVDVTPNIIDRDVDDGPVQARFTIPFVDVDTVIPESVRISSMSGVDVSGDDTFVAATFSVTDGVATATFSRAAVNAFLQAHQKSDVPFVISGSSTAGWSFEGTDTVKAK